MVFWHRIGSAAIERLPRQCRIWYSLVPGTRAPAGRTAGGWREGGVLEEQGGPSACRSTGLRFMAVRFFAAPVQAKPRPETKDPNGPRINQAITSAFVRLVTDEGHGIVSRQEALDRARKLNLDLVEVQRTAKPPVCKIMDYHKEKYTKETMEKERSKSKSGVSVRKGDFKEVRLQGKIEKKDIEMKAEMVKGLMERGYRVKCMAIPPKKKRKDSMEELDLAGLLSRLSALIEDVSIVESGPFMEREQAYVIVRHVKFGHPKKGSRTNASKNVETTSSKVQGAASSMPRASSCARQEQYTVEHESGVEMEDKDFSDQEADAQHSLNAPNATQDSNEEMAWSGVDVTDDFDKVFSFDANRDGIDSSITGDSDSVGGLCLSDDTSSPKLHQKLTAGPDLTERSPAYKPVQGSPRANQESQRDKVERHIPPGPLSGRSEPLPADSNWHSQSEMNGRFQQMKSSERSSTFRERKVAYGGSESSSAIQRNQFIRGPVTTDARGVGQQRLDRRWVPQQPPSSGSQQHEQLDPKQRQTRPVDDSSPSPSYGFFSSQKTAVPDDKRSDANRDKEKSPSSGSKNSLSMPNLKAGTPLQDNDKTRQGGFGIFSR